MKMINRVEICAVLINILAHLSSSQRFVIQRDEAAEEDKAEATPGEFQKLVNSFGVGLSNRQAKQEDHSNDENSNKLANAFELVPAVISSSGGAAEGDEDSMHLELVTEIPSQKLSNAFEFVSPELLRKVERKRELSKEELIAEFLKASQNLLMLQRDPAAVTQTNLMLLHDPPATASNLLPPVTEASSQPPRKAIPNTSTTHAAPHLITATPAVSVAPDQHATSVDIGEEAIVVQAPSLLSAPSRDRLAVEKPRFLPVAKHGNSDFVMAPLKLFLESGKGRAVDGDVTSEAETDVTEVTEEAVATTTVRPTTKNTKVGKPPEKNNIRLRSDNTIDIGRLMMQALEKEKFLKAKNVRKVAIQKASHPPAVLYDNRPLKSKAPRTVEVKGLRPSQVLQTFVTSRPIAYQRASSSPQKTIPSEQKKHAVSYAVFDPMVLAVRAQSEVARPAALTRNLGGTMGSAAAPYQPQNTFVESQTELTQDFIDKMTESNREKMNVSNTENPVYETDKKVTVATSNATLIPPTAKDSSIITSKDKSFSAARSLFDPNQNLSTTVALNTLPHLLNDVEVSVINSQPRLQDIVNGRKLSQKELYVFYMTLLELQKVLTATLSQQRKRDIPEELSDILRKASDHNMDLVTMLFKQIVQTDTQGKAMELSAKETAEFRAHLEFLKKVFPFL